MRPFLREALHQTTAWQAGMMYDISSSTALIFAY